MIKTDLEDKLKVEEAVNGCKKWCAQSLIEFLLLRGNPLAACKRCAELGYWKTVSKQ